MAYATEEQLNSLVQYMAQNIPVGMGNYIDVTGTLAVGETSLTLSNNAITTDSTIQVFTDTWGVTPTAVATANGSVTLTFDAQESALNVKIRVSGNGIGVSGYTLTTASANTLGGVKVGNGLAIDANGVLSAGGGTQESVSVTGDGVKTYQQLLYELFQLVDMSKIKGNSYLFIENASHYRSKHFMVDRMNLSTSNLYLSFTNIFLNVYSSSPLQYEVCMEEIALFNNSTNCSYTQYNTQRPSTQTALSSNVVQSGFTITIYY